MNNSENAYERPVPLNGQNNRGRTLTRSPGRREGIITTRTNRLANARRHASVSPAPSRSASPIEAQRPNHLGLPIEDIAGYKHAIPGIVPSSLSSSNTGRGTRRLPIYSSSTGTRHLQLGGDNSYYGQGSNVKYSPMDIRIIRGVSVTMPSAGTIRNTRKAIPTPSSLRTGSIKPMFSPQAVRHRKRRRTRRNGKN